MTSTLDPSPLDPPPLDPSALDPSVLDLAAPHNGSRGSSARATTLRLAGAGTPGSLGSLDPVCVDDPATAQLARLSTRSLFGYVGDPDPRSWRPVTPEADLAAVVPSMYNAGTGASGLSFVVMLRPGVMWDTTPARPVSAHDVIRGLKRLANPVRRPGSFVYFASMIRGMAEFGAGYREALDGVEPTAAVMAAYQDEHDIAGVFALDDETVMIELTRPALDVAHLLALPCAAPAPQEYDRFVPGSAELEAHLRSTGPYRPVPAQPGEPRRWEPNPAWTSESDPLRDRHLTAVELELIEPGVGAPRAGEPASAGRADVAERVRVGAVDLVWGTAAGAPVTDAADVPSDRPDSPDSPDSPDPARPWSLDPYLRWNPGPPDAAEHRASADARMRVAVARAIDDDVRADIAVIAREVEPSRRAEAATGLIPPGNAASRVGDLPPVDPSGPAVIPAGDPSSAVDPGRELVLRHDAGELDRRIAAVCVQALRGAGLAVRQVEGDDAAWDLEVARLHPAWSQHGGRVFVEPFVDVCADVAPALAPIVERALDGAVEPDRGAAAWQEAEDRIVDAGVAVPLLFRVAAPPLTADRVTDLVTLPSLAHRADLTSVRLREP